jgi:hypothetical protein
MRTTCGMFATYFNQHVLTSTLKQAAFMQRFGALEWGLESASGKLTFGRKTTLQAEILGTYSSDSGTWLWAWGNPHSPRPDEMTRISRGLRQFGTDKRILELTTAELPVTQEMNHHLIGLLAIGLAKLPAYFAGTHAHGAVLLGITTPDCNPLPALDNLQVINHVTQVVSQVPVTSHREAVIGFCTALKWKGEDRGSSLVIRAPLAREGIEFTLDAQQRITAMTTRVIAAK